MSWPASELGHSEEDPRLSQIWLSDNWEVQRRPYLERCCSLFVSICPWPQHSYRLNPHPQQPRWGRPPSRSGKSSSCSTSQVLELRSSVLVLTYGSTDDFEARSPDELSLSKGDRIELIERDDDFGDGWYLGKHLQNGKTGLFPEGERSYPQ